MEHPRNPELEARIVGDPDDQASRLVYADWLLSKGDPWGELIVSDSASPFEPEPLFEWDDPAGITSAVSRRPIDSELYKVASGSLSATPIPPRDEPAPIASLRQAIRRELLGDLADEAVRLRWRGGFIDGVFIPQRATFGDDLTDNVFQLLDHPAALAIRELGLGAIEWNNSNKWSGYGLHYNDVIDLLAMVLPPALETLVLGAWEEHDISWTATGDFTGLYGKLPRLRTLELQGNGIELGDIELPGLSRLLIRSGGLPESAITSIANAAWPALESLVLWFGELEYGGTDQVEAAEPFLSAQTLPAVRWLGLANAMFTDELCERLASATVLPQLAHLDLSKGTMTDAGGRALLRASDALAHLEGLDLRGNCLSQSMCERLAGLCKAVDVRFQRPDRRYVTVGE